MNSYSILENFLAKVFWKVSHIKSAVIFCYFSLCGFLVFLTYTNLFHIGLTVYSICVTMYTIGVIIYPIGVIVYPIDVTVYAHGVPVYPIGVKQNCTATKPFLAKCTLFRKRGPHQLC